MTLKEALTAYLQHLHTLGRSLYTIKNARSALRSLLDFLEEQHLSMVEDLQSDVLEEYQQDLAFRVTAKGKLLALRTQGQKIMTVKSFTKFLKRRTTSCTILQHGSNFPANPDAYPRSSSAPTT